MVSVSAAIIPLRANSNADDRVLAQVFAAYMVSATIWLVFATAVGLLVSFKFTYPDFPTTPALSFGRLRAIHTNAFYAWASQTLIGLAEIRADGIPHPSDGKVWRVVSQGVEDMALEPRVNVPPRNRLEARRGGSSPKGAPRLRASYSGHPALVDDGQQLG